MKYSLKTAGKRVLTFALCALLVAQTLSAALLAGAAPEESATLAAAQTEPKETVTSVPAQALDENGKPMDVTVSQYEYAFSSVPTNAEEIAQYKLDSPYKTMALLIMAFRMWTPENPGVCLGMLDYLTDTESVISATGEKCPFSQYNPWMSALHDRMIQNDKWKYIGNAYLGGATPENNYTPNDPVTVTLRQSVYDPYAKADEWGPEQKQVLIFFPGADNERYCLFFQDDNGNWKVFRRSWINLLADVKASAADAIYPPEVVRPASPANPQKEPTVTKELLPAKAAGIDENGDPIVIDTSVEQYTFTFSTAPKTYEDIVQYKLDSPYKAMALLFMAYRAWTPDNPSDCLKMMDYLTNTKADSGKTDAEGHKLATPCSEYNPWTSFIKDRMTQNNKYRYIGNAYLGGASPSNDYTPDDPITVTVRQSVYDPYKAAEGQSPELKQVLIHIDGADNDRYSLFYQDERGDWRVFSDFWKGLLADVQKPVMDILMPPETVRPATYKNPQVEPVETVFDIPAKAPGVDDNGQSIVMDVTVKQHTFTFSTIPTCYEDIIQYKLDSPYKTMALMIMAFRTWTPENKTDCLQMMDYLTNTDVDSYKTDANGRKLSKKFSEYQFWTDFVRDRMTQNNKYRYIGNAYLDGAMPSNDYTPTEPYTVTVRESVYNPYKRSDGHETDPTLYQVLTTIPGADNDRYSIFYQDQRGDWRVFGDNWKGLLTDVKTPTADIPLPPEVVKSASPAHPQTEPKLEVTKVPGKAVDENDNPIDITLDQYAFTFSTVPTCYEDIVQYKLDTPYKTMALLFLAFRAWTPDNPENCLQMLDYLTNTATPKPDSKDANGKQLCYPFSEYNPWIAFLKDRMTQNEKWRFIGNAYLKGAAPSNNYTPSEPITVVVRQSAYDPYKAAAETTPELKQVLVSIAGADNDRYALFYQDQRGDWRVFGDNWKGLLADIKTSSADIPYPPEVVKPVSPAHPQTEPQLEITKVPGKAVDENDNPIDITLHQYAFTFSTIPTSYEDIVQYKLDSPYKTMALLFLAFRTWTPDNPETCQKMLDYLTNTAAPKPGAKDANGNQLCYPFSEYNPWIDFLKDRMTQNDKWGYIGNAYLKGATPGNNYTPDTPITVIVRQSAYDPYKAAAETTPELKQVLVSIAGADNDRYALFYQDQRGDWRVFGDNWQGLLANVREPGDASGIFDAALENNLVTFRTENISGASMFVACYLQSGKLVSAVPATESGGTYAAQVPAEATRFRIIALDSGNFRALCPPVILSK